MVVLCQLKAEACDQFVDLVGEFLVPTVEEHGEKMALLLCQVLASLGNIKRGVLTALVPNICHVVGRCHTPALLNLLVTLLFQTMQAKVWNEDVSKAVDSAVAKLDPWSVFRMARTATRYGHLAIASRLFASVADMVSSEHFYFWATGLSQFCQGEAMVSGEIGSSEVSLPSIVGFHRYQQLDVLT